MARLVAELRPRHVLAENVPGLIKLGLDQVLADLAATGYAAQACGVPACAVGAAHIRQRIWIYAADTNGTRWGQLHATTQPIGAGQHTGLDAQASGHTDWWAAESSFCGVPDGLSTGVDSGRRQRLKQLGNAIVPQVAYELLRYVQAVDTLHYSNSKPKTNRYERTPKSTLPLVRRQVEGRP
jgi:site-specific DNA-cytosine methylase